MIPGTITSEQEKSYFLADADTEEEEETLSEDEDYDENYNAGRAEYDLKRIAYIRSGIEDVKNHAQSERDAIDQWESIEIERLEKRLSWPQRNLGVFAERSGKKTVSLIHGKIKRIPPKMSIEIVDLSKIPKSFMRKTEKISPDKKAILDIVKETGEIIDGVDVNYGEHYWKVVTK
tara:strand:- start:1995 stop:2522 length:528 start_codon:yes stop_codon:yes gene_type:complete